MIRVLGRIRNYHGTNRSFVLNLRQWKHYFRVRARSRPWLTDRLCLLQNYGTRSSAQNHLKIKQCCWTFAFCYNWRTEGDMYNMHHCMVQKNGQMSVSTASLVLLCLTLCCLIQSTNLWFVHSTGDDFAIIQQEILMMKDCKHPNIVGYFDSYLRSVST